MEKLFLSSASATKALPYLATFGGALLGTLLITPFVEKIAVRCNAMDHPDKRKVHTDPTPRWGGIGIAVPAMIVSLLAVIAFKDQFGIDERLTKNLTGLLIGGTLMMILGMLDDRYDVPAKFKLLGQIIIAVILFQFGIRITYLNIPFVKGLVPLAPWLQWALTLFWIVGITNAVNLIDGLDGLLAGVSAIFGLLFFIVTLLLGRPAEAMILTALAGSSLGFLRYNFNPARIFMGDTGSLFLGLMYASMSIIGAFKTPTAAAMLIPVLILGLPIFDTSFAIVRRFINKKPIFSPDKEHVHHQLLAKGLSVKQAVFFIYLISGTLGAIGLSLAYFMR